MFINQYMTANPLTVLPDTPIPKVRDLLQDNNFRHLPVVDEAGILAGMVTDRDLRSAYPSSVLSNDTIKTCLVELESTPVNTIMSKACYTLSATSTLDDALIMLDHENIGAMPVVDGQKRVIGIFSIRDLIAAYRQIFGLGERGSAMIVLEDDGKRKPLTRIAKVLEEHSIRFTRLIRTEGEEDEPGRIYLRVNTFNISAVHHALEEAGFTLVVPGLGLVDSTPISELGD